MIEPRPAAFITGTTERQPRKIPVRFTASTAFHFSSECSIGDAGVVDQDVDRAPSRDGPVDRGDPGVVVGDIERLEAGPLPELGCQRRTGIAQHVGDDHPCAGSVQRADVRRTERARRGHNRDSATQPQPQPRPSPKPSTSTLMARFTLAE
jgi:hypothetical protein